MPYHLSLSKEYLKFSASHFTIFDDKQAEALHGHNYYLSVDFTFSKIDDKTQIAMNFQTLKEKLKSLCDKLDEKILVPEQSPFLNIVDSPHYKHHVEIQYSKRHYVFPREEALILPLKNITSEALAEYLYSMIKEEVTPAEGISVSVMETSGQTATYNSSTT